MSDSIGEKILFKAKSCLQKPLQGFLADEDGYALTMTLVAMPMFLGLSLLIIDLSRANNAHTDLYAASDALALAGARELNGEPDAITRAQAAMARINNSVSFLSRDGSTTQLSGASDFTVTFLREMPASDDTNLQTWLSANPTQATLDGEDAAFVYVRANTQSLSTFFPSPATQRSDTLSISAEAVATYTSGACKVAPVFVCNPFEADGGDLRADFAAGKLHGRLIELHPKGNQTAGPGNFSFLKVPGHSGAKVLRDSIAGTGSPACFNGNTVTTEPGNMNSVRHAFNVRFDIYDGNFKHSQALFPPALNVRKGYATGGGNGNGNGNGNGKKAAKGGNGGGNGGGNNVCSASYAPDNADVVGFERNETTQAPGQGVAGATIGSGPWPIDKYAEANHGRTFSPTQKLDMNSRPNAVSPGIQGPSRYDVYRFEIDNAADGWLDNVSKGGEEGTPECSKGQNTPSDDPDRRVLIAPIINCLANPFNGRSNLPVEIYASFFLTSPMEQNGQTNDTINIELIDIAGPSGLGTLDDFFREQALLVR